MDVKILPETFQNAFKDKDLFKDIVSFLGEVLVGFVFILESLIFFIRPQLKISLELLNQLLDIRVSFASAIVILFSSYLIGYLIVLIYQLIETVLIKLNKLPKVGKVFNPILNFLFPLDLLSTENKTLNSEYKEKILNRLGKYFDLPHMVGAEIFRLSKQLCTKHKGFFRKHMIILEERLSRGLFINFCILFFYALSTSAWILSLISLVIIVALLIEIHVERKQLRLAVYETTYLTILLEEKEEKAKSSIVAIMK